MHANTVAAIAVLLGCAAASPLQADPLQADPLQGRTVEPIQWEVQAAPSGEMLKLNGTIESIHEQLLAINPNYEAEFAALPEDSVSLDKRTDFSTSKYECFGRWRGADSAQIEKGINYLRKVPGKPTNGPGPGNCGRVSCSRNSAITWCNDGFSPFVGDDAMQTPRPKMLNSFGSIADGAAWIKDYCRSGGDFPNTAGQIFHPTGWNVIVNNVDPCK